MNLIELREQFKDKEFIPYVEFLKTDEWKQKRDKVLQRDGYRCTNCGCTATIEHYDTKLGKKFYLRFEEDNAISSILGDQDIPKAIFVGKPYHFEIHHNIYILNRLPWEYDEAELLTLCNWCHWEFHENNQVTVYSEDQINELIFNPCKRCNGAGWFPEYSNIEGGVCFRCRGARFEEFLIKK